MSYIRTALLSSMIFTLLVAGCDTSGSGEATDPVASVTINADKDMIAKGQATTLLTTVTTVSGSTLANPMLTWSSSNPSVLAVSETGRIEGIAAGSAIVTATSENQQGMVQLRVLDLTGRWRGSSQTPLGDQEIILDLVQQGNQITGTYTNTQFTRPGTQAGIGPITGELFFDRFGNTVEAEMGCPVTMMGAYIVQEEASGELILVGTDWDGIARCTPREFTWPMGTLRGE